MKTSLKFFLFLGILLPSALHASSVTWTNVAGGNWSSAANWSPNQVPASGDDVIITNIGTYTVSLDVSATIDSLTLGGTSGTQTLLVANTLILNNASTVGGNGLFSLNGGTLSGLGSLTLNGPFNWSNGTIANAGLRLNGTSSFSGVGTSSMQVNGPVTNAGAITWSGSGNNLDVSSLFTNQASGTVTITTDVSERDSGGTFGNAGLVRKTGGTGTTQFGLFVNSGDLQVQSGTVNFNNKGVTTGTIEVSAGATLQFTDSYTLSPAASVMFGINSLSSFGKMTYSVSATLNGTIGTTLNAGYVPVIGNSFPLITYTSYTGTFTNFNLPTAVTWQTNYTATTFSLNVISNSPPVLAAISNQVALVGVTLTLTNHATDVNLGQSLTFSLNQAPTNATIDPASGVFSWTPLAS
jgi:hypothetical protein